MKKHNVKVFEILISLEIEPLEKGEFLATSRQFPGLIAQGRTMAETIEIAQDVARKLIESHLEHGDPLPRYLQKQLQHKKRISSVQIPVPVYL